MRPFSSPAGVSGVTSRLLVPVPFPESALLPPNRTPPSSPPLGNGELRGRNANAIKTLRGQNKKPISHCAMHAFHRSSVMESLWPFMERKTQNKQDVLTEGWLVMRRGLAARRRSAAQWEPAVAASAVATVRRTSLSGQKTNGVPPKAVNRDEKTRKR